MGKGNESRHLEWWKTSRRVVKSYHLKCTNTQDKTKKENTQVSLNTLTEFLFLFQNSMSKYLRQDTLYIGESDWGARVKGVGALFVRNLLEGRLKNPKPKCTCHERWVWHKPKLLSTSYYSLFFYLNP